MGNSAPSLSKNGELLPPTVCLFTGKCRSSGPLLCLNLQSPTWSQHSAGCSAHYSILPFYTCHQMAKISQKIYSNVAGRDYCISASLSLSAQLFKPDKTLHPCGAAAPLRFQLWRAACVALHLWTLFTRWTRQMNWGDVRSPTPG